MTATTLLLKKMVSGLYWFPLFVFSRLWCSEIILPEQRSVQGHAAVAREDKYEEGILVVTNLNSLCCLASHL